MNRFNISDGNVVEQVIRDAELVELKKNNILIKEGEAQTKLFFLLEGGLRGYKTGEGGNEITDCFVFTPGDTVMSIQLHEPSCVTFVAYKPSKLVALPLESAMELIMSNEETYARYIDVLTTSSAMHADTKFHLYTSAAQRYEWFLSVYPNLVGEVSDRVIASFLGITPVTLSRLRHTDEMRAAEAEALTKYGEALAQETEYAPEPNIIKSEE